MRVMVVDDDSFFRDTIASYWTELGHQIIAKAANGEEAVAIYRKTRPDLVTMDADMPIMDGLTALAIILKFDPLAKVVICSANDGLKPDVTRYGAIGFIPKPFKREHFRAYG